MRLVLVALQGATFLALGGLLMAEGSWRLGVAQFCLAAVTALVYV